jgi:sulfite exporter TauE/SafE
MYQQIFISAFSIGLLSSFHCVGMCGAFAFSIPVHGFSPLRKTFAILLYNTGRVFTYAILGVFFGIAGRQIYLGGFQQWFSIIAGIVILIIAVQLFFKRPLVHLPGFNRFNRFVQDLISKFINDDGLPNIFMLGIANGLLPCGLVYLAIAGALGTGTIEAASVFMIFFGLGTLPAMFALSYFGFFIKISIRNTIKKAMPIFIAAMGVLLIVRGMGLGIAYLSPGLTNASQHSISCHK